MTRPWKTLLVSVALFQIVLTVGLWRMGEYAQWLHFNDSSINYQGLMDTRPGRQVGTMILVSAAVLVLVNLVVWLRSNKPSSGANADDTTPGHS